MSLIIGSARIDEKGNATGGTAGDQKQTSSTNDTVGEVSMQNFYVHSKGWHVSRPKSVAHANKISANMKTACNNPNVGYNQDNRYGVVKNGVNSSVKTDADCSSLVRECVKEATGIDPGDFTTGNEVNALAKTGLFEDVFAYTSNTVLYNGDILTTKTKGHTVIVVSGNPRTEVGKKTNEEIAKEVIEGKWGVQPERQKKLEAAGYDYETIRALVNAMSKSNAPAVSYYPKYTGKSGSIVDALTSVGEKDTSFSHRTKIATKNGISGYKGNSAQNTKLLELLKGGKLIKA